MADTDWENCDSFPEYILDFQVSAAFLEADNSWEAPGCLEI